MTRLCSRLRSSLGFETHSGQDRTEGIRTAGACGNEERLLADCQGLRNTHTRTGSQCQDLCGLIFMFGMFGQTTVTAGGVKHELRAKLWITENVSN